jgi:hypothetical protein
MSLDGYTAAFRIAGTGMGRREFVGIVGAAAWPLGARAQSSGALPRRVAVGISARARHAMRSGRRNSPTISLRMLQHNR